MCCLWELRYTACLVKASPLVDAALHLWSEIASSSYALSVIRGACHRYGRVARYWDGLSGLCVSISDPEMLQQVGAIDLEKRVDGLNFLKGLLGASSIG